MKTLIPESLKRKYRYLKKKSILIRYRGKKVWCPCCSHSFKKFMPFGLVMRWNAKCPNCGSLERHRLQILFLTNRTNLLSETTRLLHFAPEHYFFQFFSDLSNIHYFPVDLQPEKYQEGTRFVDITSIHYPRDHFDAIICNHVLEHVPDDAKAMLELCRVLKPGGWAIIQVPLDKTRDTTYEDFSIIDPDKREKAFGQSDHVRVYGQDYKNRLEMAGFIVTVDEFAQSITAENIQKYGIMEEEDIYFCRKTR